MLSTVRSLLFALSAIGLFAPPALAAEPLGCTVIIDVRSGDVLVRQGTCDQRFAPASTFKLPLAAIGFDAGILVDATTPRWDWHKGLTAPKRDQKAVDPTIWERDSVLWYSREITRKLGAEAFATYVSALGYGNMNVSGTPGKKNGLTHSWIGGSLTISPDEQATFVRRLLLGQLPLDTPSQAMAAMILPDIEAGDWTVSGKTGSSWVTNAAGTYLKDRPLGWFIGWAVRGDRVVAFARLRVDGKPSDAYLGPLTRTQMLEDLPALLADR